MSFQRSAILRLGFRTCIQGMAFGCPTSAVFGFSFLFPCPVAVLIILLFKFVVLAPCLHRSPGILRLQTGLRMLKLTVVPLAKTLVPCSDRAYLATSAPWLFFVAVWLVLGSHRVAIAALLFSLAEVRRNRLQLGWRS
ncbi:unnamed protein product [Prorocentrum cordatum]|uniref:Glycerophosphocholine acyltransferase 1 n=1 Tax=Prorocentrum cordatum TaxID=2364126 RepID=A0ABN9VAK3_9DINO|nr:unnamed protein product [Polarella glacialis]